MAQYYIPISTTISLILLLTSLVPAGLATETASVVDPARASIGAGQTVQFQMPGATSWRVNNVAGGSATTGTISSGGLYRAPATVTDRIYVTVKGVRADGTSGSAYVSVNPIDVQLTPSSATVGTGLKKDFEAVVLWTTNTAVTWSVNGIVGGNPQVGTISQTGDYVAPAVMPANPTFTVKAVSQANPSKSDTSVVTVRAPGISVSPSSTTMVAGSQKTFVATLSYTGNMGVRWLVNEVVGGNATVGTISPNGVYTAPATAPTAAVTVKAISLADTTKFDTSVVTVQSPKVSVYPSAVTLTPGAVKDFGVSVSQTTNTAVDWLVNEVKGGSALVGTINGEGVYTAPAVVPAPNVVTVKAVSVADRSQSATAAVTLVQPTPRLSALEPYTINLNNLPSTVIAKGSSFVRGAQVLVGDVAVATTFVSDTELSFSATAAAAGSLSITVRNPAPNQPVSGMRALTVNPPIAVTVTPATRTIRGDSSYDFSSKVENNPNQKTDWYVNDIKGGNAALGTIDGNGVYKAPVPLPSPASVTIKAVSVVDAKASATSAVTLLNPVPVITSATPDIVNPGATTVQLAGTGFIQGAKVKLGGVDMTVKVNSPTSLVATGTVKPRVGNIAMLTVENPDPGTAVSKPVVLSIAVKEPKVTASVAARFLEQASWGPTPESLAEVQQKGIDAWLEEQFAAPASGYPDPVDTSMSNSALQMEFFRNALSGKDQLRQRVAFALSQIFVVSGNDLTRYHTMVEYQRMLQRLAFGNYKDVLREVTLSPAMGRYLNMVDNAKPDPVKGLLPNENYAREVLQLFSIGLTNLNLDGTSQGTPSYSEETVKQFTLAFTGWTYPPQPGFQSKWKNPPNYFGHMVPFDAYHDKTEKTLLNGVTVPAGRTAEEDLDAALDSIFRHPNVGPFIALRLIQRMVTGAPSPAYVARVAAAFNGTDGSMRGDLKATVRAILKDPEAGTTNPTVEAAPLPLTQGHLREPVLFSTTLLRALGAEVTGTPSVAGQTEMMGQKLFYSPSVFNYFSPFFRLPGTAQTSPEFQILNPTTALARVNFVYKATTGGIGGVRVDMSDLRAIAGDPAALIEAVNVALHRGQMSAAMKASIRKALDATTDVNLRVRNALYLAATASSYQVQR